MLLKKRPKNDQCWAGDWKLGATNRSGAHVLLPPTKEPCAYGLRRVSKRNQTATSVERGSSCMARTILRDAQRGLLIRMPPMYTFFSHQVTYFVVSVLMLTCPRASQCRLRCCTRQSPPALRSPSLTSP
ncbi:hypothetical protein KC356_g157 [Hortaea werneckii]|nr:hypothetical protein KC356_g157 [Hortaea werneckii]